MVKAMCLCGLDISNCWFVDVPYSTNLKVYQELLRIGVSKDHRSELFNDPIDAYSRRQLERVEYILSKIFQDRSPKSLLVIDDGAYFIRTINYMRFNNKRLFDKVRQTNIHIVEQTTRGHVYLETDTARQLREALRIPVVSIARSKTKRELESPFIGASASRNVVKLLNKHGHVKLGNAFILGFGCIGKATANEISKFELDRLDIFDKESSVCAEIKIIGGKFLGCISRYRFV